MEALLYSTAALSAYFVGGWNPAITFSKAVYKKDIRDCGSGNPGFTNFKRVFGGRLAWVVMFLDLFKAAVVVAVFAYLFGRRLEMYHFGAAYTGAFAILGHAFPIWYGFNGGKGFLVGLSTVWVIDWRVGLITTLIMMALLLTVKYMSLSTVTAMLCSPLLLFAFGIPKSAVILSAVVAAFITLRHSENIKRLISGTESKFSLKSKSKN